MQRLSETGIAALHIFILSGFAFAQPMFEILSHDAGFFVIRRAEPQDILLLVFLLCIGLPTTLVGIELAAGFLGQRVSQYLHRVMVAGLVALIALPALKPLNSLPDGILICGAIFIGGVLALGYGRFPALRTFVTVLSPAVLLFPVLFLFYSPVSRLVFPVKPPISIPAQTTATTPVIMVIFDEFPVTSLMNEHREIDVMRYPHFAALANDATWFRNATTVSAFTNTAVPAIVSGLYPDESRLPTRADYPYTLLTLPDYAHTVQAFETISMLSPEVSNDNVLLQQGFTRRKHALFLHMAVLYLYVVLPSNPDASLRAVRQVWRNFWGGSQPAPTNTLQGSNTINHSQTSLDSRVQLFTEFLGSLTETGPPALYFLHMSLPHGPWEYLPSGKRYNSVAMVLDGLDVHTTTWEQDEWLVMQAYQRHLLQVGYVDTLLGRLIDRLRKVGLYDRSLLVVAADHGVSFRAGDSPRSVTQTNFADIMSVPLFIKAPQQRSGVISDQPVETIDVFPTVVDLLNLHLPWPVDGRSVRDLSVSQRDKQVIFDRGKKFTYDSSALEARYVTLEKKLAIFGSGLDSYGLFKTGLYPDLVGRRVSEIGVVGQTEEKITLDQPTSFANVNPQSDFVPAYISGRVLTNGNLRTPLPIVIAINGTIQAVTQARDRESGQSGRWEAVVAEQAFKPGQNHIEMFTVSVVEGKPTLHRIAP